MIILYETPLSPYGQKIKIALREKGIEFEAKAPEMSDVGFDGHLLRAIQLGAGGNQYLWSGKGGVGGKAHKECKSTV